MNFLTGIPRGEPQPSPIYLSDIFMHYSRTNDQSIKRGHQLLCMSKELCFLDPELSKTAQCLGREIIEASEMARAEMMLLYLSRDRYGLPEYLTVPSNMFKQR